MTSKNSISRRDFLIRSALLTSATGAVYSGFSSETASAYKMGIQLFSIREPLSKDLAGTIKKIAGVGYQDSETYGYDPVQGTYYGIKAGEFKKLLSDHGMITTSGHYDFTKYFDKSADDMLRFVDQCIVGANVLGQRYITWPWLDPAFRTIEHFRQLTGKLNVIGERIGKAGLGFAYHHHDFEFTDHNGENGYDIIMRNTDARSVKLQMDLYWIMRSSKLSPAELIEKQPGRFVMWHIKDMDKISKDYSELGNGSIDFTKILPLAKQSGLEYYYIEQGGNFAHDPVRSVTDSAHYFRKNLEKFLTR
jgi:sugar phosphate isomerase/epimerase